MSITENVKQLLSELPPGVELVAAVKGRPPQEIAEAVAAGVKIIGENHVQQAERDYDIIGKNVTWHMIGHLQKNKAKAAARIFDMVETLDSLELAKVLAGECYRINKTMPILIEVNIAREDQKSGIMPEKADWLVSEIAKLPNLKVKGLMTVGPNVENTEDIKPYFAQAKKIFDRINSLIIPGVEMAYLSMGMSGSYRIAIEEGANLIRIGTNIFAEEDRHSQH